MLLGKFNAVKVESVPLNFEFLGDGAVANVRFQAANREDAKTLDGGFLREGAEWKACRYHAGQTV